MSQRPHQVIGPNRAELYADGEVVRFPDKPWTPAIHAFLRHLEDAGFAGAPRVVEHGSGGRGSQALSYPEGELQYTRAWTDKRITALGALLREFHEVAQRFTPPEQAVWKPWFIRHVRPATGFGQGEVAPWNILARDGEPVAFVDWQYAGPMDPFVDLAQAAWLNAHLHDVVVVDLHDRPSIELRANQLRLFVDAYGLETERRDDLVELMIEFVVNSCANEANEVHGTSRSATDGSAALGMAWRARSAAWILRNRDLLKRALS